MPVICLTWVVQPPPQTRPREVQMNAVAANAESCRGWHCMHMSTLHSRACSCLEGAVTVTVNNLLALSM